MVDNKELIQAAKAKLAFRKESYSALFKNSGRHSEVVLEDLARFCRATKSTFHPDPRMHAVLEGRREVFLRIQQHLQLSQNDLWKLLGGPES